MKFSILFAIAALCITALCQYCVWDARAIFQFQADDNFALAYELRGNDFMCAMRASDKGAGMQNHDTRNPPSAESIYVPTVQYPWKTRHKTHKWFLDMVLARASDFDNQGWGPVIRSIQHITPDWHTSRYIHYDSKDARPIKDQWYQGTMGGEKRYATGASINLAMEKKSGIILFQSGTPPTVAAKRNWGRDAVGQEELPRLRAPSDFMWGFWRSKRAGTDVRYCGVQQVNDCAALKLIARYLLKRDMYDLESFPALNSRWSTETPEGRALVASPPGQKCAAFLVQHKPVLGIKHITSVQVFRGTVFDGPKGKQLLPQMLFWIEEVPQDLLKADPPPGWVPPPSQGRSGLSNPPPSVPGPPPNPQPVMPGPSTPRPVPPPPPPEEEEDYWRRDTGSKVSYSVERGLKDRNSVRTHVFHVV